MGEQDVAQASVDSRDWQQAKAFFPSTEDDVPHARQHATPSTPALVGPVKWWSSSQRYKSPGNTRVPNMFALHATELWRSAFMECQSLRAGFNGAFRAQAVAADTRQVPELKQAKAIAGVTCLE